MKKFPYLAVSGTYRDIGLAIGETFRANIRRFIAKRKDTIPVYSEKKKQVIGYYALTKKYLPHLIDETIGIAQGAGEDELDCFLANTPEIYNEMELETREHARTTDHCTTIINFNSEGAIIGHNEDWSSDSIDDLYVLKATIGKTTMLGLQYSTYIPGASVSLNSWGLVQCINELYASPQLGIPKYYLSRQIMEMKSSAEGVAFITSLPRASGFNHVLVKDNEITNIEALPDDIHIKTLHAVPFVHTNHCLSPRLAKKETLRTESSVQRLKRARSLVQNVKTPEDMKVVLSDKENTTYPICKHAETIASVIVQSNDHSMLISYGPPCKKQFTRYIL